MKHVFSDISKIAHMWANQLQTEARNSGKNFYFEDKTIYSYGRHFPIAKHVANEQGVKAVLFTERIYSVTTSKHLQVVRQAISHLNVIYCYNPESTHKENFAQWLSSLEIIAANLKNARKPEKYLNQIKTVQDRVSQYAVFYGIEIPESLVIALSIGSKEQYKEYADKKAAYQAEQEKKAAAQLKKDHKKALGEWLKCKTNRLYLRNGVDYLRLNNGIIETTQAVKIPFEYGKKLYNKIKDGKLKQGEKILDFEVSEVGKQIKVGCHTFNTDYVVKFGAKIFS